ncbi:hypothetical protein SERLA73DRAFT_185183 [Serpula lacrymans var. lacrymans S7.3]|uniref:Uncharacterized protein n=1 Tax=Serpula lacrymans var. lacrymans (strain S7.3) TaxID=936435 RepID=F8Q481_SERL3|nr:hypothetical protein SERLA73DRAFT_185183 [Serpula lacrymans var. lacrymans S7.3]
MTSHSNSNMFIFTTSTIFLSLASPCLAQYYPGNGYNNTRWSGSLIGGVIVAIAAGIALLSIICVITRRRRRATNAGVKPGFFGTSGGSALPYWQNNNGANYATPAPHPAFGTQAPGQQASYGAARAPHSQGGYPPPPMGSAEDPVAAPPPPYMKGSAPNTAYAPPIGPPPPAHTNDSGHFVGGMRHAT